MNDLQKYIASIPDGLGQFDPLAALPTDVVTLGYKFGINVPRPAEQFFEASWDQAWEVFPSSVRDSVISNLSEALSKIGGLGPALQITGQILSGAAGAIAFVIPYLNAVLEAPGFVVKMVEEKRTMNDSARRDARVDFVDLIATKHPRHWVRPLYSLDGYPRYVGVGKKHDYWPMIYPRSGGLPLGDLPAQGFGTSKDCDNPRTSGSDFCGLNSCQWSWVTYAAFFPYFHPRAFGNPDAWRKGNERSFDSGAAIGASYMALQTAVISNPIVNLMVDGRDVEKIYRYFREFFWNSYYNWSPKYTLNERGQRGMFNIKTAEWERIDAEFNVNNQQDSIDYLYLAPNGLIGAYTPTRGGSTVDDTLRDWVVYTSEPPAWVVGDVGGYFITAADYNAIITICQAFFATRRATLTDVPYMKGIVNNRPELLTTQGRYESIEGGGGVDDAFDIPEAAVRRAILAASGSSPPSKKLILDLSPSGPESKPAAVQYATFRALTHPPTDPRTLVQGRSRIR